jgi:hypothetical protein
LFEDPVLAPDGVTYERSALKEYVATQHRAHRVPNRLVRSPVNRTDTLGEEKGWTKNRKVAELVEVAVELCPDHELVRDWVAKKRKRDMDAAEDLFKQGRVEEAARLGHEEAQMVLQKRSLAVEAAEIVARAQQVFRVNRDDPAYRAMLREAVEKESQKALSLLGEAYVMGYGGAAKPGKANECFMRLHAVQAAL